MTSNEYLQRATECAARAGLSRDGWVESEFMVLAAYWRAMAAQDIFLGHIATQIETVQPTTQIGYS
jgi:hypothetical protein